MGNTKWGGIGVKLTKKCSRCQTEKLVESFCKHRGMKDGRNNNCKECVKQYTDENKETVRKYKSDYYYANREKYIERDRKNSLKRKYNVTVEWYEAQLKKQNGKCMICGTTESGGNSSAFHVDHNHETGQIRDLLCRPCNTGIGLFKENTELLKKAIEYVNRHSKH